MADEFPLSVPQRELWFAHQLDPSGRQLTMLDAVTGAFDPVQWAAALRVAAERHEALRTGFALQNRGEVAQTASPAVDVPFEVHDARGWSADAVRVLLRNRATYSFDLTAPPLFRAYAIRTSDDVHYLLHVFHHLIADAASWSLLREELIETYESGIPRARAPDVRFRDYVALEQRLVESRGAREWTYWTSELAGASLRLDLPRDRPRPARSSGVGGIVGVSLDPLQDRLAAYVLARRSTVPRVLLAAFGALLHRYSNMSDFVIGVPVRGRPKLFDGVVGTFANIGLVRIQIEPTTTFDELVDRCTRQVAGALQHQTLPLGAIAERLGLERGKGAAPYDVMYNINLEPRARGGAQRVSTDLGVVHTGLAVRGATATYERCTTEQLRGSVGCDLAIQGLAYRDGIEVDLEFDADLYETATIEQTARNLVALLDAALAAPDRPIQQIELQEMPERGVELRSARTELAGSSCYVAPRTEREQQLATIWSKLLGVEQIGIHDNFFALGGHSLLAVRMLGELRRHGLALDAREVFATPTLEGVAAALHDDRDGRVPASLIAPGATAITPAQLPLISLTQADIDSIVAEVPGGTANVQDIYALTPLQEGLLFHHQLTTKGDPYLLVGQAVFPDRALLDQYLAALQRVLDRHDALRTSLCWQGMTTPAQVVWRNAPLRVTEIGLGGPGLETFAQLAAKYDPRCYRLDLTSAPLMHCVIAKEPGSERWFLIELWHHIVTDHESLALMRVEIDALLAGRELAASPPFRNLVAQVRLGELGEAEHERYFRSLLGDIDEPTRPFDLTETLRDGSAVSQAKQPLPGELVDQLRAHARRLGVSVATLCHVAWGQVLARTSGREHVVFGTVLFGRMQLTGGDRAIGMYLNTLPVRIDVDGTSVEETVRRTQATLGELMRHEHASLVLAQRCSGVAPPTPLFSALLNYRHSAAVPREPRALAAVEWLSSDDRTNYPLTLSVDDVGAEMWLTVQVADSISPRRVCAMVERALEALATALAHAPDQPLGALDILPPEERQRILVSWNATARDYPTDHCLHELFEAQVDRTPDAVAVELEGTQLTYRELDRRANQLAHHLRSLGVGPDVRVGVCAERSLELVVALYGVLKAGGAYVPLDPSYPRERLAFMVEDAAVPVLLTQSHLVEGLPAHGARVVRLDADGSQVSGESEARLGRIAGPSDLAYVIFTSGSTGRPKGAMNEHGAVVNRLQWMQEAYGLDATDAVLQKTPFSFDVSVWELFWPLQVGARLVMARPEGHRDPAYLVEVIRAQQITTLHFVPSMLSAFLDEEGVEACTSVRRVVTSGEALAPAQIDRCFARLPAAGLFNLYGPTEAAIDVTHWTCRPGARIVPIGRPIANIAIYVLDASRQPVPVGVAGELYIGGVGVGRGYLNRPELTAEKFVANPFGAGRLYRTGDLARWLADETIEYLGRIDHQVKIRGFRIELGEIEAVLAAHATVGDVAVLAREDAIGDKRLVAYVVGREAPVDAETLRAHAAAVLPEYMVPSAFVVLAAMPVTPNGKLDRKALPAPDLALSQRAYVAPRTNTEELLAAIWCQLLGVERVGVDDNFFELGGHSVLAMQLASRVRKTFATELAVRSVFETPTLHALAKLVESFAAETALPPLVPVAREGDIEASFGQLRFWIQAQLDERDAYDMSQLLRLPGALDVAALGRAVDALVARHEVLRTTFVEVDGRVLQRIAHARQGMLAVVEVATREAAQVHWDELRRRPYDLATGPLFAPTLVLIGAEDHLLVLRMHHVVADEWSIEVMRRELTALYRGEQLAPLAVQYADYAAWQRSWLVGDLLDEQLAYWRTRLTGVEVLELPTDRPRPAVVETRGAMATMMLPPALVSAIAALGRAHGATPFMSYLAAFYVLLYRYSHQEDIAVGTPVANRNRPETEALIGYFLNTVVLRADLSGNPTFTTLLAQVRDIALDAYAHQDAPFEQVVEAVQPIRSPARTPLFQVMFVHERVGQWQSEISAEQFARGHEVSSFDMTLFVNETADGVSCAVEYNTDLFFPETIVRLMGHYATLLESIVAHPEQAISMLPILDANERQRLLVDWNATSRDYPRDACLHALFEAQVDRAPAAVALVLDGAQLTYGELEARANQLAHDLIALGAGPEVNVGVFVERSIEMVVGILGILKAGAAYVPLETKVPADRLAFILQDASANLVITQARLVPQLGEVSAQLVRLDADAARIANHPTTRPQTAVRTDNLAYVIYTSGSTGRPKGVQIEHRQIVNLVTASGAVEGIVPSDRVLQFSSIAFDSSVEELFTPLAHGATLVLRGEDVPTALELFGPRFAGVTVMNMATAYWHAIAMALQDQQLPPPPALRMINIGGERALPEYLRRWDELMPGCALNNQYGPTETTVMATAWRLERSELLDGREAPIGKPLPNYTAYVLDSRGEPVPLGVEGELYIGGDSVARGYLARPDLTAQKFVDNRFGPGRLYRTGDVVRWRADGNLEFVGRVDDQVKIRGFRIELGEIEAMFAEHPAVQNVAVVVRSAGRGDKQLVAYVVLRAAVTPAELGAYVGSRLPAYMVPARLVVVDVIPISATGKVNKAALPDVAGEALAAPRTFEPPKGDLEVLLAGIWRELLGVGVGRNDNFFELGGHSLLAMRMLAQLRRLGLTVEVRTLFATPTLSTLASTMQGHREVHVPPNAIVPGNATITPAQLPLIELTQADIDHIGAVVPGGLANVQDIYALAPLQEGILFHHQLATAGDPYVVIAQFAFPDRALLDRYLAATQRVIDRHDILRTAIVWEGLSAPAQVVLRQALMVVTEIVLEGEGPAALAQLAAIYDLRRDRLDLSQAPLHRYVIAQEPGSARWLALELSHHLIGDHESLELMRTEVEQWMTGREAALPAPHPFRNLVAATRRVSTEAHEQYFRALLGDVEESSSPFGIADAHQDGTVILHAHRQLPAELTTRLRVVARQIGISVATLCHVAWGQVVARTTGRTQVVFGTVLFGRMQVSNADSALGLYMNTLPIRLDLDETGVLEAVKRANDVLAGLMAHEHASLALAQRCSGVAPPTPLFSSLLNYRHGAAPPSGAEEDAANHPLQAIEWLGAEERSNYAFMISIDDGGAELGVRVQAVEAVAADRVCGMMASALENLATALERTPHLPVRTLDVLAPDERQQLLVEWNATSRDYPRDLCVHELFEAQVDRTPDAAAVELEGAQLTYGELDRRANQLAHHLRSLGVGPDVRVGVCVERSLEMVVAVFGILKAGGAYVPLDPSYPPERVAFMLEDAAAPVVIAHDALVADVTRPGVQVVRIDADRPVIDGYPVTRPLGEVSSDLLAYVMYTSGTTGRPKGVMIPHRAVVNFLHAMQRGPGIASTDTLLAVTTLSFDIAGLELYLPLVTGAKVVLASRETARDGSLLAAQIEACGATIMQATPATWRMLVGLNWRAPARLRVLCGGEALPAELAATLLADAASVWNLYGPTETTIWSTCLELEAGKPIMIGRAIDNTQLYVLDAQGQLVPPGVAGELYIGGAGIARGYLGRPDLTAERFAPDPFAATAGARMYRTGDLVRWLGDATLEYLGRIDHQVKIRGFRIELGEIESVLAAHASVREVVAIAREDVPGDKRLVAYVVAHDGPPAVDALRAHASAALPAYMVPSAFVVLDAMPLTPNGKLDRKALPAPDSAPRSHGEYVAPRTVAELALAEIWCELLQVDKVGVDDNFFELGGHSLLAVRMIAMLRRQELALEVRTVFATPTLAAMAAAVTQHREVHVPANAIERGATAITPAQLPLIELTQADIDAIAARVPGGIANIQDIYALSPLQEGMLFHHQLAIEGDTYLVVVRMVFPDRALLDRYLTAMQRVVDRHDTLRTSVCWEGLSTTAQVVWRTAPLQVVEVVLDGAEPRAFEQLVERYDPRHYRLDLSRAPLMQCVIAQEPGSTRWLVIELWHHLISDHESLELMQAEVELLLAGREEELRPSRPFRDLVAEARLGGLEAEHARYFRSLLWDIDEPTTPFGLTDTLRDGHGVPEANRQLPDGLVAQLRAAARRLGVSMATLCHVAWGQVVARTSGREQVVFGTVLFGRMHAPGADRALGLYLNTLPIRIDLDATSVEDTVRRTQATLAELIRHEHAPLSLAQRCSGVAPPAPLFSTLLNYRHSTPVSTEPGATASGALAGVELLGVDERTNYPLMLSVDDVGADLWVTAQVAGSISPDRVCAMMVRALENLATALEKTPHQPVRTLDVLAPDERQQLLVEWNATSRDYPRDLCVHELFEAQVDRTPDAVAVEFEGAQLTYGELDRRANQLAHHLRSLGVGPDVRVGVCAERSLELVVALYGVLKAGGAYVPLDPSFPAERLAFMVEDAAVPVLLTQAHLVDGLPSHEARVVRLDADRDENGRESTARLGRTASPTDLAYVIFTSGSTGRPKGVMVPHGAVVNFLHSMARAPGIAATDTLLAVTTLSFDIAGLELYLPMVSGAKVVIASRETARDAHLLAAQIEASGATIMQATPATWRMLTTSGWRAPSRLRVLCGGEAMPADLAATLLAHAESVWNLYGPTETTIWSTCSKLAPGEPITIGLAIDNTLLYVLDAAREPVPAGVAGELYIGGEGVGRGYMNRPELTAEKFVANPFGEGRLYRTGDLARRQTDGTVEYLGRLDHQVKIRGFRIELGEIEAVLAAHGSVREVVVLAREDAPGDKRLVAYVVGRDRTVELDVLRAHASAALPEYMVPSAFVVLDAMPVSANGKLDRKALPAPDLAQRTYVAPRTPVETGLAELWGQLLHVDRVGVDDDFFALGGHSLLVGQLVARIREWLGVTAPLASVFRAPTIAALARLVAEIRPTDTARRMIELSPAIEGKPTVFCVHALGGSVEPYLPLAASCRGVRGFVAFEARGAYGEDEPYSSVPEMAKAYVSELNESYGSGPVHLLGWSFGGLVVYEMRRLLVEAGVNVLSTTMVDTGAPVQPGDADDDPRVTALGVLAWSVGAELTPEELATVAALPLEHALANLVERARRAGGRSANVGIFRLGTLHHLLETHLRASIAYVAPHTDARIVLVNAAEESRTHQQEVWRGYAPNLELYTSPGDHEMMVRSPNVGVLHTVLEKIWR